MPPTLTLDVSAALTTLRGVEQRVMQLLPQLDRVVLTAATEALGDILAGWPVDTGVSRAAWWGPRQVAPGAYALGNPMVYAWTIEYGGYRGVGPKTIALGGQALPEGWSITAGIYPRQVPAAPVRRALAQQAVALPAAIAALIRAAL